MKELSIREWGRIESANNTVVHIAGNRLQLHHQSWSELADLIETDDNTKKYFKLLSRSSIGVKNYVGVITLSDGTSIEILPKVTLDDEKGTIEKSRQILWKMLSVEFDLPYIEATEAALRIKDDMPLPEVLIGLFLEKLTDVVRRGLRKDYERIEAQEKFLKGQLLINKQIRQPPGQQHLFQIEYDIFSENRAENRLIHSALIIVSSWSKDIDNQRVARELRFKFDDIPISRDHPLDFNDWRTSRDMIYYQPLLPWLKLILHQQSPFALKDVQHGISFLFPMEKLFEKYVAHQLAYQFRDYQVKTQKQFSSKHLVKDVPSNKFLFRLYPDLGLFSKKKCVAVLDTKWKMLDKHKVYAENRGQASPSNDLKRGISQSDMYQLFAYGHLFMKSKGVMAMIYPKTEHFQTANDVGPFQFTDTDLILFALPFDFDNDQLILPDQVDTLFCIEPSINQSR